MQIFYAEYNKIICHDTEPHNLNYLTRYGQRGVEFNWMMITGTGDGLEQRIGIQRVEQRNLAIGGDTQINIRVMEEVEVNIRAMDDQRINVEE